MRKILSFIQRPSATEHACASTGHKLLLFAVLFILNGGMSLLFIYLVKIIGMTDSVSENYQTKYDINIAFYGPILFFIMSCTVFPVIEEIIFRLGLSFQKKHIALSFAVFIIWITISPIRFNWLVASITIPLALVVYLLIGKTPQTFWDKLKKANGNLIIYAVTTLFTILHLLNYYPLSWDGTLYYLLYIFHIFIQSIMINYLRIAYGFIYSCAFHMLNNFIPSLLVATPYLLK